MNHRISSRNRRELIPRKSTFSVVSLPTRDLSVAIDNGISHLENRPLQMHFTETPGSVGLEIRGKVVC